MEDSKEEVCRIFQAMTDPNRVLILGTLKENMIEGMRRTDIAKMLERSDGGIDYHITKLQDAGLIGRDNRKVYRLELLGLRMFDVYTVMESRISSEQEALLSEQAVLEVLKQT